nr:hypothetical protein PNEFENPC_00053 [Escherichia coli]WBW56650.1 hypothetical protein BGAOJDKN_00053 [Escherichia coli]
MKNIYRRRKIHAIGGYFKYGKNLPLSYMSRATLRKEIYRAALVHEKQMTK